MTREQCHRGDLIDRVLEEVRLSLERTDGSELAGQVKDLRNVLWMYSKNEAGGVPADSEPTQEVPTIDGGGL